MNHDFTTKPIHASCSSCGCEELRRLLYPVWYEDRVHRFCTSCVLLSHKGSFCPTCFAIYDINSSNRIICCYKCNSHSHAICFFSNGSPSGAPSMCSFCINPNRIIFARNEVKAKGDNGNYNGMDKNKSILLITAAKIAAMSMTKAYDKLENSAEMIVTKTVLLKKKARGAVSHVMELDDKENNNVAAKGNNNDVALLVDSWTHSEEDNSPETLRENRRLQRLTVEGVVSEAQSSRVAMDIDLNEEYPSVDDAIYKTIGSNQ